MGKDKYKDFEHCTAFCPECRADLYYLDGECYCKNSNCNWSCGGCARVKELFEDKIEKEMPF